MADSYIIGHGESATIYDLDSEIYSYKSDGYAAGTNGLSGFKTWECYMLLKYGNQNSFGISGEQEYLIEIPIYPESVTEQIAAKWQTQDILGRSSPISAYASTELKSVHFSLDLHRDLLTGSYSLTEEALNAALADSHVPGQVYRQAAGLQMQTAVGPFGTRSWYVNMNKMLQMALYPQYTDYGLIPPTTYFIFGQMILKGYVRSYSTDWNKPILNTFYSNNHVDIQMDCYPDSIIGANEIISGGGARSTQNTYNTQYPTSSTVNSDVMRRTFNGNFERTNARSAAALGGNVLQT